MKKKTRRECLAKFTDFFSQIHICRRNEGHRGDHVCGQQLGVLRGNKCRVAWKRGRKRT